MNTLSVVNWSEFQQYKDRAPKWIKVYNQLLDNYEFSMLPDAARWHLMGIWLLASRTNNVIPDSEPWIRQAIKSRSKINLDQLVSYGFLERNRTELYESVQNCTQSREEKRRVEESRGDPPTPQGGYPPGFLTAWADYPHQGTRSKKPKAAAMWKKRALEPQADSVHAWIQYAKTTEDWRKEQGRYVPGMQVWLDRDFTDPPPEPRINLREHLSEKGARSAENMQRWLEEEEAKDAAN